MPPKRRHCDAEGKVKQHGGGADAVGKVELCVPAGAVVKVELRLSAGAGGKVELRVPGGTQVKGKVEVPCQFNREHVIREIIGEAAQVLQVGQEYAAGAAVKMEQGVPAGTSAVEMEHAGNAVQMGGNDEVACCMEGKHISQHVHTRIIREQLDTIGQAARAVENSLKTLGRQMAASGAAGETLVGGKRRRE